MVLHESIRITAAYQATECIMKVVTGVIDEPVATKEDFDDILKRIENLLKDEVM